MASRRFRDVHKAQPDWEEGKVREENTGTLCSSEADVLATEMNQVGDRGHTSKAGKAVVHKTPRHSQQHPPKSTLSSMCLCLSISLKI